MAEAYEVGTKLVELCRDGHYLEAIDSLYSNQIQSEEAMEDGPQMKKHTRGLEAVRAKTESFMQNHEIHSQEIKGPFPHGDHFAVVFGLEVTPKSGPKRGQRMKMEEVALYTVREGKIVREEFLYPTH